MSPVTMTKNPEAADYGAVPSSPGVDGETMNLIQKQAAEAIEMATEAKRTSRLSASLLVGAAALFFAGYAFSSSVSNSKQMRSKLSVLGYSNSAAWYRPGFWPSGTSRDEVADFCSFESFDIDSPHAAAHPCLRCYLDGVYHFGDDVRTDASYAIGATDFAKCYAKGIKAQGREVTKADYTMKPLNEMMNTCEATLDFQNDYFRENEHWTNPEEDDPILTEDGFGQYSAYCFNHYFMFLGEYCAEGWY